MTETPDARSPRGALLRFLLMVAVLVAAFLVFRNSNLSELLAVERISASVEKIRAQWWSPLALVGLWTVMSPLGLPASPIVAAGAVVFGTWWGTLYNCIGAMFGATTTFYFARLLGQDFVAHLLGEERVVKVEHRLEQMGFRALVAVRFLPLPWPLINFAAPLAGVRFTPFILATAMGIWPIIFIYTLFFSSLVGATTGEGRAKLAQFAAAVGVLALLVILRLAVRRRAETQPDS